MYKRICFLIIPILIMGFLPATGCGQSAGKSKVVVKSGKGGYLGVTIQEVDKKLNEKKDLKVESGAYVADVAEDSPAEDAGIREGDVIVGFNGKRIDDPEDLTVAVRKVKPKTEVKVELVRKGEKMTLTAVVGKMKKSVNAFAWDLNDGVMHLDRNLKSLKLPKIYTRLSVSMAGELSGLKVQSLTKQLGEFFGAPGGKGVLVSSIKKGSEAEKAGFKAGDVIVKMNNSSIDDVNEFQEEFSEGEDGEIPFVVIRNGKSVDLKMKVEAEDADEDIDVDIDEDDDWSIYNFIPPDPPGIGIVQSPKPPIKTLRDRLIHLRDNIEDKIEELRDGIREYLRKI